MDVVWDPKKASFNFAKHGVMFSDAATVLDDPYALTIEDRRFNEERFVTVGSDASVACWSSSTHIRRTSMPCA
jgi:hypothetical protein